MIAGFRTTYSDWLLNHLPASSYNNSKAGFYDGSVHITHTINAKNTLYLMGYMSSDKFTFDGDTSYAYSNANANLRWKHNFSDKSYGVFTTGIDHYQYSVSSTKVPVNAYKLSFNMNQVYFHADFSYTPNNKHNISYGLSTAYYQLHPGDLSPDGSKSLVIPNTLQREQALESAIYLGDCSTRFQKNFLSMRASGIIYIITWALPQCMNMYRDCPERHTGLLIQQIIPKEKSYKPMPFPISESPPAIRSIILLP